MAQSASVGINRRSAGPAAGWVRAGPVGLDDVERSRLEETATSGDAEAMYALAYRLSDSVPDTALNWAVQAETLGHPAATFLLGCLVEASDPDRAMELFRLAAERGCAPARTVVGYEI